MMNSSSEESIAHTGLGRVATESEYFHRRRLSTVSDSESQDLQSPTGAFDAEDNATLSSENYGPLNQVTDVLANSSAGDEPKAKKRRKQSNPVRYGHHHQPSHNQSIHSFIGDEPEEGEDILGINTGLVPCHDPSLQARVAEIGELDIIDQDDENDETEKPLDLDQRRRQIAANILNFSQFQGKFQYYCPHCSCPFATDLDLKIHIEEEHVQKLLERQLLQHQQHLQGNKTSNGLNLIERSNCGEMDLTSIIKREDSEHTDHRPVSRELSSCGSSSNNSPLESPSTERKSYDSSLPHNHHHSDQHTAKELASILPFQLPNVPPLVPFTQSSGMSNGSSGGSQDGKVVGGSNMQLSMFSNPMAPFMFPVLPHSAQGGQSNMGATSSGAISNGGNTPPCSGGIRIFNPEAYCELCNKEFCNKYFLKTHKANKHGIYSMDTVTSPGNPFPSNASAAAAAAAAAFFPAGLTNNSATAAAIQMQHLLQQASAASSGSSEAAHVAAALAVRSAGMINLESYCEICQKEFCNKYFLKKHKQKIHGIIDPNSHSQQHSSSAASPSSSNGGDHSNQKMPSSPHGSPMDAGTGSFGVIDTTPSTMASITTCTPCTSTCTTVAISNSNEYFCDVCKLDFPNIMMLQTHKMAMHGPPTSLHGMLSSAQLQTMASLQAESLAGVMGRQIIFPSSMGEAGNLAFTPEKLREMGVINPEAFCELCCKEFCNKYFLRTHKMNKHGIGSTECGSSVGSSKSQNGQHQSGDKAHGSREENNMSPKICGNDDSGLEPGQRDTSLNLMGHPGFSLGMAGGEQLQCEICSRPFSSHYLLRMHKFYSHNIPYVKEEEFQKSLNLSNDHINPDGRGNESDNHSSQRPQSNGGPNEHTTDQASQDLQRLQSMIKELNSSNHLERTTCMHCRQEFENKYFLRVHILNDHGLLPEDANFEPGSLMRSMFDPSRASFPSTMGSAGMFAVGSPGDSEAFCEICQKEFCSKYFLKTHRQNIHGIPFDSEPDDSLPGHTSPHQPSQHHLSQQQQQQQQHSQQQQQQQQPINNQMVPLLQQHRKHETSELTGPNGPTSQKIPKALQMPSSNKPITTSVTPITTITTPPSSMGPDGKPRILTGRNYCNICNKELCNKYFMKTHMLKMHGINIDEHPAEAAVTSTIGGVTCDICQKELCSKYFLKVHKQNTHGIYEEPPQPKEPRPGDLPLNLERENSSVASQGIDPNDTNNRYFSHYTEVCPLCERRFKSIKWLKTHMINDHSDLVAVRQSDVTPANLSNEMGRMCVICGQTFSDRVALQIHLIKDHRSANTNHATDEPGALMSGINSGKTTTLNAISADASSPVASAASHQTLLLPINVQSQLSQSQQQVQLCKQPHQLMLQHHSQSVQVISAPPSLTPTPQPLSLTTGTRINGSISPESIPNPDEHSPSHSILNTQNNNLNSPSSLNGSAIFLTNNTIPTTTSSPITTTVITPTINANSDHSGSSMPSLKRTGSGTRIYQCSYCNYSTRWLSNLYAHEKRHTRLNTEGDKKFVCRICHRAYRYNHSLQRHLLNHRPGLRDISSVKAAHNNPTSQRLTGSPQTATPTTLGHCGEKYPFGGRNSMFPLTTQLNSAQGTTGTNKVKRYRCSKCNKKFRTRELCLSHIHQFHSDSRKIVLSSSSSGSKTYQNSSKQVFRCVTCGYTTRNYNLLKTHISKLHSCRNPAASPTRQEHDLRQNSGSPLNLRKSPDPSNNNNNEALSLVVKDRPKPSSPASSVSSNFNYPCGSSKTQLSPQGSSSVPNSQLPMTYAMPQSPPNAGSFIMQPFLITQPESDGSVRNDTFVPSLVFLPVCQKVLQPLTVAFQLTPA